MMKVATVHIYDDVVVSTTSTDADYCKDEADVTAGTITTVGYSPGDYVCQDGNTFAMMEDGIAVKSGFAITNGLGNYSPAFNVTLRIQPLTEGFVCPNNLIFVLKECAADTMITLTNSALLNPPVDHVIISNNLENFNPMSAGTYIILWTLSDDLGNKMDSCEQTITVKYTPCINVTWKNYTYEAVRIGSQCWLTENLRWATGNHHAYQEDDANVEKFGYLYSWYTAVGVEEGSDNAVPETRTDLCGQPYVQGICPDGWAMGSETDFALLSATAGSTSLLKDPSALYWLNGDEGVSPNTGFNARSGGWYNTSLYRYEDLMTGYHFWQSDAPTNNSTLNSPSIIYYCDSLVTEMSRKADLKSVRCIRKIY